MKRFLIIHKCKEDNTIRYVYLAPKTIKSNGKEIDLDAEYIQKYIADYKSEYDYVQFIPVQPDLAIAIEYLAENRTRSINEHLKALKEIESNLSEMSDFVYSAINDMKRDFAEQIEKENKND